MEDDFVSYQKYRVAMQSEIYNDEKFYVPEAEQSQFDELSSINLSEQETEQQPECKQYSSKEIVENLDDCAKF